jgi:sugar-specific transcriptional regulator TrmB
MMPKRSLENCYYGCVTGQCNIRTLAGLVDDIPEMATVLRHALNLSEYESRAYLALMTSGEVSPSELAQRSEIPRPRTYDVLRTLVRKGLATERLGRPLRYAGADPRNGLPTLSEQQENAAEKDLERRRAAVDRLIPELGKLYDDFRYLTGSDQKVTVGSSSRGVWKQLELLKQQTKEEYVGASLSAVVPPYEIFVREEKMLRLGIKMKLLRPFPGDMRRSQVGWYLRLIKRGFEIRSSKEVEFSFDVSDSTNAVVWLNERVDHPPTEAVWFRHAPLARMLREHFQKLWRSATPVEGRLRKMAH